MQMRLFGNAPIAEICVRGLIYALAIATLVTFWPSEPHVFIYPGF
jgi:hypothetical protein